MQIHITNNGKTVNHNELSPQTALAFEAMAKVAIEMIKKGNGFTCDYCQEFKLNETPTPYISEDNEDLVYCQTCIDKYHETGEWE